MRKGRFTDEEASRRARWMPLGWLKSSFGTAISFCILIVLASPAWLVG